MKRGGGGLHRSYGEKRPGDPFPQLTAVQSLKETLPAGTAAPPGPQRPTAPRPAASHREGYSLTKVSEAKV